MEEDRKTEGAVIDAVVSGYTDDSFRLPNGYLHYFKDDDNKIFNVWKTYEKPMAFKLNALQIEYFQQQTYPIIEIKCRRKNISKFKEWWWTNWNDDKIYDIEINKVGEKTVTMVKTVSGKIMYLDQDVSAVETAVDSVRHFIHM